MTSSAAPRPPQVSRPRLIAGGFGLPALLLGAVVVSLLVGAGDLTRSSDVGALLAARGDRTAIGALVGAAIAVAGAALQGVTRNPLADPGILGLNAGAALFVVMGIAFLDINNLLAYTVLALLGAGFATVCVALLTVFGGGAFGRSGSPLTVALAGMVFTAGASSIAQGVLVADAQSIDVYRYWQVGSVGGRQLSDLVPVAPFFIVGFALVLFMGRRLDVLAMGDSVAVGLGERPGRTRVTLGAGALLLAASATALCGPIAFVGLVAPHLLRLLIGTSYRLLLPASALVGATIVVLADTLGRVVSPPGEVQVGIMTAVIGCPVLLWVLVRMRSL